MQAADEELGVAQVYPCSSRFFMDFDGYFLMIFLGNPEGGHRNFCIPIVFRAAHHPGGAHQPEHRREVRHDVPLPVPAGEEGHSEGGLSLL